MRAIIVLLLVTAPIYGQCRVVHKPSAVVVEPVVTVVTTPTAVLVPAFSFQYLPAVAPVVQQPYSASQLEAAMPIASTMTQGLPDQDGFPVATDGAAATTFANRHVGILQSRCAACHTSPGQGGVTLFTSRGFEPNVPLSNIADAVRSGRMPKGASYDARKRLTSEEFAELSSLR